MLFVLLFLIRGALKHTHINIKSNDISAPQHDHADLVCGTTPGHNDVKETVVWLSRTKHTGCVH